MTDNSLIVLISALGGTIIGGAISLLGIYIKTDIDKRNEREKEDLKVYQKLQSFFFEITSIASRIIKKGSLNKVEKERLSKELIKVKEVAYLTGIIFPKGFRNHFMNHLEYIEDFSNKKFTREQAEEIKQANEMLLNEMDNLIISCRK